MMMNHRFLFWVDCEKLKFLKLFFRACALRHFEYVESNGFTQWSTFTNGNNITDLNIPEKKEIRRKKKNNYRIPTESKDLNERKCFCVVFRNDCIFEHNVNNHVE